MKSLLSAVSSILICIVESWLSADIPNPDIALANYILFRCDR